MNLKARETKPRNHGKPWTKGLERELMELLEKGESIDSLEKLFERTRVSIDLTIKRIKIENFLKERKVEKLVHFTDLRNLSSIEEHGVLPINRLKEKGIKYHFNDANRYEGQLGGISVSITSRNDHLLRVFQKRNPRNWVEIELNPRVAGNRNCLFYDCNAASIKFDDVPEGYLSSLDALKQMFSESVESKKRIIKRINKESNETTDNQAEIIVRWGIPKSHILGWKEING